MKIIKAFLFSLTLLLGLRSMAMEPVDFLPVIFSMNGNDIEKEGYINAEYTGTFLDIDTNYQEFSIKEPRLLIGHDDFSGDLYVPIDEDYISEICHIKSRPLFPHHLLGGGFYPILGPSQKIAIFNGHKFIVGKVSELEKIKNKKIKQTISYAVCR